MKIDSKVLALKYRPTVFDDLIGQDVIKETIINIGSPIEMTIKNYASLIRKKIDPKVLIKFNNDKKLDGVMRKKLNLSLANQYGWKSKMNFSKVIDKIIKEFKNS